uniref:Putative conserved secreted protein n=1 Tax=Corethrella appendiculata TaxID=1370023 RepID=U5EPD0_9DIPT
MKSVLILFIIALNYQLCFASQEQRQISLKVFENLKFDKPEFKELTENYVVKNFIQNILQSYENVVKLTVSEETKALEAIKATTKQGQTDTTCTNYLKKLIDNSVSLSGFAYRNCLSDAYESAQGEVRKVQGTDVDLRVLRAFRSHNIFDRPAEIMIELGIINLPSFPIINNPENDFVLFEKTITGVTEEYKKCNEHFSSFYTQQISLISSDMKQIC